MKKRIVIFISFICFNNTVYCQSVDSLKTLIKIIQHGENDEIRKAANIQFKEGFEKILSEENTFTKNFDSLKNVSALTSEDKKLRLYTWVLPAFDGSKYTFYGYIQYKNKTADTLFELKDSTEVIKKPESEKLNPGRWIGAIYYKILEIKKGKETYYTLLGWKAKDQKITQKIIEILYFDDGKPRFGYPMIKSGTIYKNRMLFTFNAQIAMTLNFNKNFDGIVYDHLGTNKNNLSQINGPDGTYDGLKFKKGKWILLHDIDVRSKWEPKENLPKPKENQQEPKE